MNNVQEAPQPLDVEGAAEAILNDWSDDENLSESEVEATDNTPVDETKQGQSEQKIEDDQDTEDSEETDTDPVDEDQEDNEEENQDDTVEEVTLSEDTLLEIQVDGENKQVSIKDLKRLAGQEASLTRKSQETAAKRKEADEALKKADMRYRALLEKAEARLKPFSEVDMVVASQNMAPDEFAKMRNDANQAQADLDFLTQEAGEFYKEAGEYMQKQQQEAAQNCIQVLSEKMPDWGDELYNDIRRYAVSQGLPQEQVDQYVDPQVIMLINKARLYDQTKASAQEKKAKAKLIKTKGNKKVMRSNKSPDRQSDANRKKQEAMKRLHDNPTHDLDNVADYFLTQWQQQ